MPSIPPRGAGWFGEVPTVGIGGSLIGPPPKGPDRPLGGPYSPDGAWTIAQTDLGLLLTGPGKPQLWRSTSPPHAELGDCVVANGGKAVTCTSGARAVHLAR